MSRVLDGIEAKRLGRYSIDPAPFVFSVKEDLSPCNFEHQYEDYFLGVELGHVIKVKDSELNLPEARSYTRRALQEFIFGEFRPTILKAISQLYNRETDDALITIKQLERDMFYDSVPNK